MSHYWAISLLWPDLHRRSVEMEALALAHNPKLSLTGRARWARSLPRGWRVENRCPTHATSSPAATD